MSYNSSQKTRKTMSRSQQSLVVSTVIASAGRNLLLTRIHTFPWAYSNFNTFELPLGVTRYSATTVQPYFFFNRFITKNNLSNPVVFAAFLGVVQSVETCLATHVPELNDYEIVIVLSCVSERTLKFYYYIVNHENGSAQWAHRTPTQVSNSISAPMRRQAEYWHHRSCFTEHRLCSRDDLDTTAALLQSLPEAVAPRAYVEAHLSTLRQIDNSNIAAGETAVIAQIRADALKKSLPEMRDSRSTMMKAFHGLKQLKSKWLYHPSVHGNSPTGSPSSSQEAAN